VKRLRESLIPTRKKTTEKKQKIRTTTTKLTRKPSTPENLLGLKEAKLTAMPQRLIQYLS